MCKVQIPEQTKLIELDGFARFIGQRLYSDRRGNIEFRPRHTNAGIQKIPRHKCQFKTLPGGK
ncbi:hypothetical protein [Methylohalobius crimeensis]|uniref:hypothetical protein n=1 Tax=Methylohalobius crimeensis TaxID=244365 RepID=UPI0003B71D26|nr:hypothetical protein [Methylohalobius crimeensis]